MKTKLFDYDLPQELIAQTPAEPRDTSRLLVFNRSVAGRRFPVAGCRFPVAGRRFPVAGRRSLTCDLKKQVQHDHFYNLPKYLTSNDVLVFNNSKVFPARIKIGKGEIFLLKQIKPDEWECLTRNIKIQEYKNIKINNLEVLNLQKMENGNWQIKFNLSGAEFEDWLDKNGQTPLPPYIKTQDSSEIRKKYQTVYSKSKGSVAAPTAGLHFTENLFDKLKNKGVQIEFVTLHVGLGTFQPVKSDKIEQHRMHAEWASLDSATCDRLNAAKKTGKNIIAVGTTTVRVLESASDKNGQLKPTQEELNIFIKPGYKFKFVDKLITNFHLPKSSLLMLVSAFLNQKKFWYQNKKHGVKKIKQIYQLAIQKKYRFYSFGDGMLIT